MVFQVSVNICNNNNNNNNNGGGERGLNRECEGGGDFYFILVLSLKMAYSNIRPLVSGKGEFNKIETPAWVL